MVQKSALGIAADTGLVDKALCSMSGKPGRQATPLFSWQWHLASSSDKTPRHSELVSGSHYGGDLYDGMLKQIQHDAN